MSEMPDSTPAHPVIGGPELLATKLYLPRPLAGIRGPPAAGRAARRRVARELTLVCAPAGFGKTSLLADWSRRGERPWHGCRWTPVTTIRRGSGATSPPRWIGCGRGRRAGRRRCSARRPAVVRGSGHPLINELAAEAGDELLVLDDYHLIEAQPVHASLAFLLEHCRRGCTWCWPAAPTRRCRWRGCGPAASWPSCAPPSCGSRRRRPPLCCATAVGSTSREDAVAALAARTEGWAAGLQLAALSLRGQPDVAGFVRAFSGSHRYVLDYLTEEVLERQPEPVREFLLETSVLERLSGPLCDAVTGRADGQAMLEAIERANLFLVPLDEVRGWWRYHHLFADLLRARLSQERPERVGELHRNAAAVARGARAGRRCRASRPGRRGSRLGGAADRAPRRRSSSCAARERPLQRWLAALPPAWSGPGPGCCSPRRRFVGRVEEVEGLLDAAERASARRRRRAVRAVGRSRRQPVGERPAR